MPALQLNNEIPMIPKPSQQMRAILTIFNADPNLMALVNPFIDLRNETISWDPIYKLGLCSGHRGAVGFAYSLWTDEIRARSTMFDNALGMNPVLQAAILEAICIRWGLKK